MRTLPRDLASVIEPAASAGRATIIELAPLDRDAVAALATDRLGSAVPDELVSIVLQRSGGVPLFAEEIVEVTIPQRKGDPIVVSQDEGIRAETTAASLGRLRPAFAKEGTITAGNASQISDGAAALVVASRSEAERLGKTPIAYLGSHGVVAGPDPSLHEQPAAAIEAACAKEGISVSDLDVVEINEAFAAVAVASIKRLGIDGDRVNVNGGAIALGHPIGMSGARLVLHLIYELRRRGGGIGAAALCGGGGQGDALIVEVPAVG